jgi:hypothetical protein
MKKVLLVDPTFNPGNIPPNLGMGRIEAALSASGVRSEVADFVEFGTEQISLSKFEELENEFILQTAERAALHEVVYISGSHGMELKPYAMFPRIRSLAKAIKKVNPNATVVMGGALASYYSKVLNLDSRLMTESCIDEVVLGQEVSAAKVILNKIGVEYRTPLNAFNQDALQPSWKAWDLTKYPDYISLMIRTGCPYTCSFCFEGAVYDPKIPQALPADIPKVVANLKGRHQINSVMVEDSIAISLPWFPELAERMAGTDLTWAIYARSNEIVQHSKD